MKQTYQALLVAIAVFMSGCSTQDWMAAIYVFRAESAVDKATHLKSQKVSFEDRKTYYIKGCELFIKAYEKDVSVFTLTRIEQAADTCWKADDREGEAIFRDYEQEYIKYHPQEYEYGDSGVGMMEM